VTNESVWTVFLLITCDFLPQKNLDLICSTRLNSIPGSATDRFSLAECIFGRGKEDSLYDDLDGHKIEERDPSSTSMSIKAQFLLLVKEV
jgi:hypothetical protein